MGIAHPKVIKTLNGLKSGFITTDPSCWWVSLCIVYDPHNNNRLCLFFRFPFNFRAKVKVPIKVLFTT